MATVSIEVQAAVGDAVAGLNQVEGELGQLTGTTSKTNMGLADLKAGFDLASQAVGVIKGAVESVIGPTIEYGKQIRDLGAFAGLSAEESSRLIQVTDDLGIEFNTVRTAAKAMSENGIQPSVKNLAALADEFNAIQDPVEQSQFLIDQFGARAGPQMAFALRQGSEALIQMGEDAERTGLVVGQDFVDSTEKARLAIDQYEDSLMAAKVALSEHLLPAVTATVTQGADFITYWAKSAEAIAEGELSLLEFQKTGYEVIFTNKTLAEATAELTQAELDQVAALESLDPAVANLRAAQEAETLATAAATAAMLEAEPAFRRGGQAVDYAVLAEIDLKRAAEDAAAAQAILKQSFDDLALALEGPVTTANDEYYDQQRDAGAVIAELKLELDKLKESHGAVYTSTVDGTEAARNLVIAQSDAATAAANLVKAQEKLSEDPGDLGLQAAVARAELAVAKSEENVIKWGETISSVNETYVIDNDTAITAVEAKLAEAQAAYDANATAHEEATARIVFGMLQQRLAMDGYTQEEIGFLTDVGEAWGIYDEKTAATLRSVDSALTEHGLHADAVVSALDSHIRNLPDSKLIEIEVRTNYTQYGAEPGPGVPPIAPPGPDDNADDAVNGAF